MKKRKMVLTVEIEYGPEPLHDPFDGAASLSSVIEAALSTPGVLDEFPNGVVRDVSLVADGWSDARLAAAMFKYLDFEGVGIETYSLDTMDEVSGGSWLLVKAWVGGDFSAEEEG